MSNLIAQLLWQGTDHMHLVDLTGTAESSFSLQLKESVTDAKYVTDATNPSEYLVLDNGALVQVGLDGLTQAITPPTFAFPVLAHRVIASADLGIVYGRNAGVETIGFYRISTGAILSTKLATETLTSVGGTLNRYAYLDESKSQWFGSKLVSVIGPIASAAMLYVYDPFADTATTVAMTGATGDYQYAARWMLKQYNGNLYVVPAAIKSALTTAPTKNVFMFTSSFNSSSVLLSAMYGISTTTFPDGYAAGSASNPQNDQYVVYASYADTVSGGALGVLDLSALTFNTVTLGTIPDASLPVALSTIDPAYTQGKFATYGTTGVLWLGNYTTLTGVGGTAARLFMWNILTGAYLGYKTHSLDANADVDQAKLFLFQIPTYTVSGSVFDYTTAIKATVELQDEASLAVIAETTSDVNGLYSFRCYTPGTKSIIATHPTKAIRKGTSTVVPTLNS